MVNGPTVNITFEMLCSNMGSILPNGRNYFNRGLLFDLGTDFL